MAANTRIVFDIKATHARGGLVDRVQQNGTGGITLPETVAPLKPGMTYRVTIEAAVPGYTQAERLAKRLKKEEWKPVQMTGSLVSREVEGVIQTMNVAPAVFSALMEMGS